ncbi:serine hydrolase domain-containing protein [Actinocatenispora sera]|uniref:serine hydrolase domain-containing protein n=1 Tax=Actinocatenispora sera TaxID=390989 RepID=UPI0034019990
MIEPRSGPGAGAASTGVALQAALDDVHRAGMPGVFAEVRDGDQVWRGAAGVADLDTGRPAGPELRHRVGSITKTFTAAAVLQQVEQGQIGLDTPIGHYLPRLVPGSRGEAITVRMLLGHTSGLRDYLPSAYPSLRGFPTIGETTPASLDEHRFTRFDPVELIGMGVAAPPVGAPGGAPGVYSNTNYLLLCQLLGHVTGSSAERYITEQVIERAGLRDTVLPTGSEIDGPHSKLYESWFGMIDPPRDYSVFDMSWVGPAASLISTMADLNRFFGLLLAGEIVAPSSLARMQHTGPVISFEGTTIQYGLGLHRVELPGHGTFWGHDGSVWGGGAISLHRADGGRQLSIGINLMRPNGLDEHGRPRHHPLDDALPALYHLAMAGVPAPTAA